MDLRYTIFDLLMLIVFSLIIKTALQMCGGVPGTLYFVGAHGFLTATGYFMFYREFTAKLYGKFYGRY